MEVGDRRIEGRLEERGQARANYDAAIATGKRAAIVEEERPGVFTLRVGNLMPGEAATITFEMVGALAMVDGEVSYRFPLLVAPRYMPGIPLRGLAVGSGSHGDTTSVPDASRISPPVMIGSYPHPVSLSIDVIIDALGIPVRNVRSALHAASATGEGGRLHIQVAPGERLNRDFILRYQLGDGHLHSTAVSAPIAGDADACMITIVPAMTSASRPRDVVFVIDTSGSMDGWKLVAARRAAARMVDSLRGQDRFSIVQFHSQHLVFPNTHTGGQALWSAASDRDRFRAVEWLSTLRAAGGTEMQAPLQAAAQLLLSSSLERDRVLVFITDGQVGNEAQLLASLGNSLHGVRLFALGIDQSVNAGFLNRLAALGGQGEAELVESEDRLDEVLTRCHRRIETPALRDIRIEAVGSDQLTEQAPARTPDVFVGVPAMVCVRLHRRGGASMVRITGTQADGSLFQREVAVQSHGGGALLPTWGRLRVRDLEDQFDGGGNRPALERSIVATSLRSGVLCRFTAYVAIDGEVVNYGGRVVQVTQPVAAAPMPASRSAPIASPMMHAPMPLQEMSVQTRGGSGGAPADKEEGTRSAPVTEEPVYRSQQRSHSEPIMRGEAKADAAPPPPKGAMSPWLDRLEGMWRVMVQFPEGTFEFQLEMLSRIIDELRNDTAMTTVVTMLLTLRQDLGCGDGPRCAAALAQLRQLIDDQRKTRTSFWK
jgi:Ca-activated chloride channel homolog